MKIVTIHDRVGREAAIFFSFSVLCFSVLSTVPVMTPVPLRSCFQELYISDTPRRVRSDGHPRSKRLRRVAVVFGLIRNGLPCPHLERFANICVYDSSLCTQADARQNS